MKIIHSLLLILLTLNCPVFADDMLNTGGIFNKGQYVCDGSGNNCVKAKQINNAGGITDNGDGSVTFLGGATNVGVGTTNRALVYTSSTTAGPAAKLYVVGDNVGINTALPSDPLQVNGNFGLFVPGSGPTGGTITTDGLNTVHTFTSNGTFTPISDGTITVLAIGGGGGGGTADGGGGGAGGYLKGTYTVTANTPISVSIGAGGLGGQQPGNAQNLGLVGGDTVFGTATALGGGPGSPANTAGTGGSGGGAGGNANGTGAAATQGNSGGLTGFGFAGGNSLTANPFPSGGGGGAGGLGGNGTGSTPGAGGIGKSDSINGSSVCRAGGGAGNTANTAGTATCGGGNAGVNGADGSNGTDGTGGGGGGSEDAKGGIGGKGSVTVSYVTSSQSGSAVVRAISTGNGRLGIGISSPLSALDVKGGAVIGLTYAGVNTAPMSGMLVEGNVGFGTASPGQALDVASAARFAAGTSASPGIIVGTNTNGFDGSVANTIGIDTNALRRVTIDSSGNVGIGTALPANNLDLAIGGATFNVGTNASGGTMYFGRDSTASTSNRIAYASSELGFYTSQSLGMNFYTATVNRLHLDNGGNVGIGTTLPLLKLDVVGSAGLPASSGTAQNGALRLDLGAVGDNVMDAGVQSVSPFSSWIQATNKANLANTYPLLLNPNGGNIGIGSTTPLAALDIRIDGTSSFLPASMRINGTGSELGLQINNRGSSGRNYSLITTNSGSGLGAGKFIIGDATSQVSRLVIDSNGNVGIGTTIPITTLDVGGSGTIAMFGDSSSSAVMGFSGNRALFGYFPTSIDGAFVQGPLGKGISFNVNNNTPGSGYAMGITSGGNVGIGTASPTALLNIGGNMYLDRTTSQIIMKDSGGAGGCTKITTNTGTISGAVVACP